MTGEPTWIHGPSAGLPMAWNAPFTDIERAELARHEAIIERGLETFIEVGNALLAIRDGELYKAAGWSTFEDYCRERWGLKRLRAYELMRAATVVGNLLEISNIVPSRESQAAALEVLEPEQQREAWQEAVRTAPLGDNGKPRITAAHVQHVVDEIKGQKPHVAYNAGNNEWYTPPEYIEAARAVLGEIDLDPASTAAANNIVGAALYYTAEDDGLAFFWSGRVWMNPPYASELVSRFSDKLVRHYIAGDVPEALVLVNNATETGWFQAMLERASAVCFVKGRVRFLDPDGNPGAPLQGQAVLYLGGNTGKFAEHFGRFGVILYV